MHFKLPLKKHKQTKCQLAGGIFPHVYHTALCWCGSVCVAADCIEGDLLLGGGGNVS